MECVGLYAKARNILLLLWHPQLKPDWLTGLPQTVPNGMYEKAYITLVTLTTSITPFLCIDLQNVISQVESCFY